MISDYKPRQFMAGKSSMTQRLIWIFYTLCYLILLAVSGQAQAAQPAGELISNQALAVYFDDWRGVGAKSLSNVAMVRILAMPSHILQTDRNVHASVGQFVNFAHLLTNTGNISDKYDVSTVLNGGDFALENLALHHDINGNGVIEPGEPAIDQTSLLQPSQSIALVVVGKIPVTTLEGQQSVVMITTTSVLAPTKKEFNIDTVQLVVEELLLFTKTTEPICEKPIDPGSTIKYSLRFSNIGSLPLTERTIVVDNTAKTGILIEDTIQANTSLFKPQTIIATPYSAEPLVKLFNPLFGLNDGWITWNSWNGADLVEKIGLLVPSVNLTSGQSGRFDFAVRIIEAITPGTTLVNTAHIDIDGSGSPQFSTNQVCNTITPVDLTDPLATNDAKIRFLEPEENLRFSLTEPDFENEAHYQDAQLYRLDTFVGFMLVRDGVYLELRSTSTNTNSFVSESILMHLESALTGDYIYITLQETGPNTGKFRSLEPVMLSETLSGNGATCSPDSVSSCVLKSTNKDRLIASTFDQGMGVVINDVAIVDPLGVVFDSVTMEILAGAQVSIVDQNGDLARNPDTGGTTALVPQVTTDDGKFQFPRIYPGTYFIHVVPPPNYKNQPSKVPMDTFTGIRSVNQYSYGRNGYNNIAGSGLFTLNAGDPTLVADVPLDPPSDGSYLTIDKTSTVKQGQVGDFVPYEIRIKNTSKAVLLNALVHDQIPYGFKYVKGSVRLDGKKTSEPTGGSGPDLNFFLNRLAKDQEMVLNYTLQITPAALDGNGINSAQILAETGGSFPVNSAVARMQIIIEREGLFSDRGILFGKVSVDGNCSQEQENTEWPLGGVRLYMEDGTWVITDENGQYSLYGIAPGQHVIKVDTFTLPNGVELKVTDNRQATDPGSRFVDLVWGEMYRADFMTSCPEQNSITVMQEIQERNQSINGDWLLDEALQFIGSSENTQMNSSQTDNSWASDDGDISGGVVYPSNANKVPTFSTPLSDASTVEQEVVVESKVAPNTQKIVATLTNEMGRQGTWLWPTDKISRDGRFMVVVPVDTNPDLWVNGAKVATSQLGEQIANLAEQVQVLAWYGIILKPGENQLEVIGRDSFGNERKLADRKVFLPESITRLELAPEADRLDADGGSSVLPLKVSLTDHLGLPVSGIHFVTLASTSGTWLEVDIQKDEPGHQIKVINGEAQVHLRSSNKVGKVTVRANLGQNHSDEIIITFMAPMRPLLAVGLVDLSASFNDLEDSGITPPSQTDDFDEEIKLQGRTALFLKGKIRGNLLLTFSYDSGKDTDGSLLRDIDPDAYYPIYGDASVKGFDAQSRSKLYVRVERGKNSLMWGDFVTDQQAEESLSRYQRTLTGANTKLETNRFEVSAFGARQDNRRITEEFLGNGTATFYQISNAPIEPNSEIIELLTRDRNNHGLVIERSPLSRFTDYTLDYLNGYISFNQAIPSQDDQGNPVFIQVTYDAADQGEEYTVAGLRLKYKLLEQITIGGGYSYDDHPADGRQLGSAFLSFTPSNKHKITLEGATMEHEDGSPSGVAKRLVIESQLLEKLEIKMSYSSAQEGFINANAPVSAGRSETKMKINYALLPGTDVVIEGQQSEDLTSDDQQRSIGLSAARQIGSWRTTTGMRHIEQQNSQEDNSFNTARLRLERPYKLFSRDGQVYGEWEQAVEDPDKKDIKVGADYQIHQLTRFYASHELINSLSGITSLSSAVEQSKTVFGVSTSALSMSDSYNEYRIRGGINGRESESATGIRKTFELEPGMTLAPQFEYIYMFDGPDNGNTFSISLAFADKRASDSKTALRVETRHGNNSDYHGLIGSYAARLNQDWTGMVKEDFSMERPEDSDEQIRHRFTLGVARRPRTDNRWHMLGLYQWIDERQQDDYISRWVHLFSTHQNYQLSDVLTLSGRLAGKWQNMEMDADNYSSTVQLLGGRLVWDITERLDFDVHGGMLSTDFGDSSRYSGGLAMHFLVKENLRVGVGYNFTGFADQDLDSEEYYAQGLKTWIHFKFDEDLFGFLKEPAISP